MTDSRSGWNFAIAVTRPAIALVPHDWLDEIAGRLRVAGVQDAVAQRNPAPIFRWMMSLAARQGLSNYAAMRFEAEHGGVDLGDLNDVLAASPNCPRLRCHWAFSGCQYRKSSGTCAEPDHIADCPLPKLPMRKGLLNETAVGLALFIRDVCDGDLVGWIDDRLAGADPGASVPDRGAILGAAVLDPLRHVPGLGDKVLSMTLAELLVASDPGRERWVAAGAALVAIDSLVHALLHRTGCLRRLGAEHDYGAACYAPGGCASLIRGLAERVDARTINSSFPKVFPRLVQFALWHFCAAGGVNTCNGNRIDDRDRCQQVLTCPAHAVCDRVRLGRRLAPA